jgi:hypothetical protein
MANKTTMNVQRVIRVRDGKKAETPSRMQRNRRHKYYIEAQDGK